MTLGARCDAVLAMIDEVLGPPDKDASSVVNTPAPAPVGAAVNVKGDVHVATVET